jgi:hypothetical protein
MDSPSDLAGVQTSLQFLLLAIAVGKLLLLAWIASIDD